MQNSGERIVEIRVYIILQIIEIKCDDIQDSTSASRYLKPIMVHCAQLPFHSFIHPFIYSQHTPLMNQSSLLHTKFLYTQIQLYMSTVLIYSMMRTQINGSISRNKIYLILPERKSSHRQVERVLYIKHLLQSNNTQSG